VEEVLKVRRPSTSPCRGLWPSAPARRAWRPGSGGALGTWWTTWRPWLHPAGWAPGARGGQHLLAGARLLLANSRRAWARPARAGAPWTDGRPGFRAGVRGRMRFSLCPSGRYPWSPCDGDRGSGNCAYGRTRSASSRPRPVRRQAPDSCSAGAPAVITLGKGGGWKT
jgi:hypothetical protein